ncbi:hypothetical protein DPMN_085200 [Dreissena polymorpha]|uniref:Uncharacterized protein n=1 Tax=Dreissena polymorpha TaxID=45954 RepID=A0A9D3YFM0_DREPO|nr:hypothetical protein DPMN_085200 [Dreissena polymorpha]
MPQAFESILEVDEIVEELMLVMQVFLYDDSAVENLISCALPSSESACSSASSFSVFLFNWLRMMRSSTLLGMLVRLMVR